MIRTGGRHAHPERVHDRWTVYVGKHSSEAHAWIWE
jgi:hypothetical protein